jgi:hypothetical protein
MIIYIYGYIVIYIYNINQPESVNNGILGHPSVLFPPLWPIRSLMTIPPPIEHVSAVGAEPGFILDAPCH